MDSVLMIGQSNMAGRGHIGEVPKLDNTNLYMLRTGRWRPLCEPVNYDRPFSGVGLAPAFAQCYSKRFDREVGLIPCADGDTSLNDWAVGGLLYDHAVALAKLAQRTSNIVAVLWHQGEGNSNTEEEARGYKEKLLIIFEALRKELKLEDVPFVIGELGEFLARREEETGKPSFFRTVNEQLHQVANSSNKIAIASSKGLTSNQDLLHFNAESLREYGERYFQAYLTCK